MNKFFTSPRPTNDATQQSRGPVIRAVPAVTRAFAILRLLGSNQSPLTLKAIADELDLIPSTCLHILRALMEERLVKIDPLTKQYSLDSGMLPLARAVLNRNNFTSLVQPELDRLSALYGLTAIGVELSAPDYMLVVAISRAPVLVRLQVDVGSRFPALISATGRCVAAFGGYSWGQLEEKFRSLRWENAPSFDAWRKEVELVKRKGYSIDRGNYISGVSVIAVPVLDSNERMTQSIVVVGLADQISTSAGVAIAEELRLSAGTVAKQLFI